MTKFDMGHVTELIQEVSEAVILPRFRNLSHADIGYKIGDDPVTIADKEAEIALSEALLALLPGSKVLGEEAFSSNQCISDHLFSESPVWIIDPIDGTRNFVKGSSEFGVIVALSEQNQTIAGWIYSPTSKEVVCAEKGSGTYFKGQKLSVLMPESFEKMHGFLGIHMADYYKKTSNFKGISPDFQTMSAGAHDYPRLVLNEPHFNKNVPQSHFRASFSYSYPWDDAAGVLMHQEAGGYSAFWDERPYQPSIMNEGLALTPNKEYWHHLKEWCMTFADLPKRQLNR